MRVFFAITFTEKDKMKIARIQDWVKSSAIKGRYTAVENFHLTLEFIGEVNKKRCNLLLNILDQLPTKPMTLYASYIGSFQKRNRSIVWLGLEDHQQLYTLQEELVRYLKVVGYSPANDMYIPHITLGRKILREHKEDIWLDRKIKLQVRSIAIMESKRVEGELRYLPIKEVMIS